MIENPINHYLNELTPSKEGWITQLENEAERDRIPIMDKQGIQLIQQIIRLHRPNRILEIGTAIGYSALRMNEANPEAKIISIERNREMYSKALRNIRSQRKEDAIEIVFGDALEVEEAIIERGPYDLIFIDAAKGQYKHFFEKYEYTLTDNGCIITDNVLFRGYVANHQEAPKRLQSIATKIDMYNRWLMNHRQYNTTIFPIGDGVALSIKKVK